MMARRRNGRPQIVLLDHGLYKRISDDFRYDGRNRVTNQCGANGNGPGT